ncbi:hypothetical protein PS2_188 [Serratia phage PS2]|uniref:Uncharacterized protein n=1 Tax=Serratia phage PS2 TaxID=1481112 RepID=A0A023W583_9CAUD|nr:hypothetical protein FF83_gp227 [Serratia phage PS2]AHY25430.1 hypothetical protein PS2_188 [Serratia phage PS2]
MAEKQMVDILDESYKSTINLLRDRLRSGIGRV